MFIHGCSPPISSVVREVSILTLHSKSDMKSEQGSQSKQDNALASFDGKSRDTVP